MRSSRPAVLNALVIESSEPDRHWMRLVLDETGIRHSVREFSSAIAAAQWLNTATSEQIDFIFVTVCPPLLDIDEAVSRLAACPAAAGAHFCVTILSDWERERVPQGCHTVVKPVTADAIRDFVLPRWTESRGET